jgi:hypothetical protein
MAAAAERFESADGSCGSCRYAQRTFEAGKMLCEAAVGDALEPERVLVRSPVLEAV